VSDGIKMAWDMNRYFSQWLQIKRRSGNAARDFVRFQGRKLLQALAWHTPVMPYKILVRNYRLISVRGGGKRWIPAEPYTVRVNAGRARAGWKNAAAALGVRSVYSRHPNWNEGGVLDASHNPQNPSITMSNSVPYIMRIKNHPNWPQAALAQEQSRAMERLRGTYRHSLGGFAR